MSTILPTHITPYLNSPPIPSNSGTITGNNTNIPLRTRTAITAHATGTTAETLSSATQGVPNPTHLTRASLINATCSTPPDAFKGFLRNDAAIAGVSSALVIIIIGLVVIAIVQCARKRQIRGTLMSDIEEAYTRPARFMSRRRKIPRPFQEIGHQDPQTASSGSLRKFNEDTTVRHSRSFRHRTSEHPRISIDEEPLSPYSMTALPDFAFIPRGRSPAAYADSSSIGSHETHGWRGVVKVAPGNGFLRV